MEGVSLALEWSEHPFMVETDSLVLANMLSEVEMNRSPVAAYIGEIKRLLGHGREFPRDGIKVAHALAQMGHTTQPNAPLFGCVGVRTKLATYEAMPE